MDERLQKALDASNFRLNLLNTKANIKLKVETMTTVAVNGGIFKASRELITFTKLIIDKGHNSVVLLDENENPIEILDLLKFHDDLLDCYFSATNYYNTEYSKLKKARSSADQFADLATDKNT
jgi:hypothetical protein